MWLHSKQYQQVGAMLKHMLIMAPCPQASLHVLHKQCPRVPSQLMRRTQSISYATCSMQTVVASLMFASTAFFCFLVCRGNPSPNNIFLIACYLAHLQIACLTHALRGGEASQNAHFYDVYGGLFGFLSSAGDERGQLVEAIPSPLTTFIHDGGAGTPPGAGLTTCFVTSSPKLILSPN